MEFSIEQKQRLQKVLFPKGVEISEGKLGTAAISPVFNALQPNHGQNPNLVGPLGFEPRTKRL
jgi:hypothetical protein